MPGVTTIQDMKSRSLLRSDDELEELIQKSLAKIVSTRFELSIYFGCNLADRHAALSRALFNLFPVPLMRATFSRSTKWRLVSLTPIPVGDLPALHRTFLHGVIENHFARRGPAGRPGRTVNYEHDLAILVNDEERSPPSNREALQEIRARGAQRRLRRRISRPATTMDASRSSMRYSFARRRVSSITPIVSRAGRGPRGSS